MLQPSVKCQGTSWPKNSACMPLIQCVLLLPPQDTGQSDRTVDSDNINSFRCHTDIIMTLQIVVTIYFNIFIQDNKFSKAVFQLDPVSSRSLGRDFDSESQWSFLHQNHWVTWLIISTWFPLTDALWNTYTCKSIEKKNIFVCFQKWLIEGYFAPVIYVYVDM